MTLKSILLLGATGATVFATGVLWTTYVYLAERREKLGSFA